ncbi:Crp/Fnr family transcriptional regulator [Bacillus shivajii]|uniref:Crp/Fnr family transcriptional regulator n=1 Tax=Bacillus shivajii TaxID=1983719 RepID=UPI001CF9D310|nr:Crp/Fnr family transcriptional regulator [Bacillus shivajii]UCZ53967.1 Crp/Fnr family transcriptional regulator [Bacillus shivajii]
MGCENHHGHLDSCIHSVPVFEGMSDSELQLIKEAKNSRKYKKGEYIFREGDPSESLYIIHQGLIKLSKISQDGKEQIIRLLFPGDFFGEFALVHNKNHYANAEVLQDTVVCTVEKQGFIRTMELNPNMTLRFIDTLNDRIFYADEWVSSMSLLEVDQRLARVLLLFNEKVNPDNDTFSLPISKKDTASLIGTTPETLSRKLVQFVSQQMIKLHGRNEIEIINREKLEAFAGRYDC